MSNKMSFKALIGAAVLASLPVVIMAQSAAVNSTVKAPLNATVHDSVTGEDVALSGTVTVQTSLALDGKGGANGTAGCSPDAVTATGNTSNANYTLSGSDSQNAGTAGPLPATAVAPCTLAIVGNGGGMQNVRLQVQITIDPQANALNASVGDAQAVP